MCLHPKYVQCICMNDNVCDMGWSGVCHEWKYVLCGVGITMCWESCVHGMGIECNLLYWAYNYMCCVHVLCYLVVIKGIWHHRNLTLSTAIQISKLWHCGSLAPRLQSRTCNSNVVTFDPANFRLVRSKVMQLLCCLQGESLGTRLTLWLLL